MTTAAPDDVIAGLARTGKQQERLPARLRDECTSFGLSLDDVLGRGLAALSAVVQKERP